MAARTCVIFVHGWKGRLRHASSIDPFGLPRLTRAEDSTSMAGASAHPVQRPANEILTGALSPDTYRQEPKFFSNLDAFVGNSISTMRA